MRNNKKGQAVNFVNTPTIIMLFGLIILIAAAVSVAINGFRLSQCSYSSDSANDRCLNATGGTGADTGETYSFNVSQDGLTGISNFSDQIPTVGTIVGVALIIVVVVGAFAFSTFNKGGI